MVGRGLQDGHGGERDVGLLWGGGHRVRAGGQWTQTGCMLRVMPTPPRHARSHTKHAWVGVLLTGGGGGVTPTPPPPPQCILGGVVSSPTTLGWGCHLVGCEGPDVAEEGLAQFGALVEDGGQLWGGQLEHHLERLGLRALAALDETFPDFGVLPHLEGGTHGGLGEAWGGVPSALGGRGSRGRSGWLWAGGTVGMGTDRHGDAKGERDRRDRHPGTEGQD